MISIHVVNPVRYHMQEPIKVIAVNEGDQIPNHPGDI